MTENNKLEKLLIVDDERELSELMKDSLERSGYKNVTAASSAEDAVRIMNGGMPDLILLDVMMPGMDGFAACAQMRRQSRAPVIFLSARSSDADKTMGFAVGGDDYLPKPFSASELLARVRSALRRYLVYGAKDAPGAAEGLSIGPVHISPDENRVTVDGQEIPLTETEYRILLLLARNQRKVFSVQNIYESVWEEPYFYSANNTVMVHVRNLRRKLGDSAQGAEIIRTVWGRGYRID